MQLQPGNQYPLSNARILVMYSTTTVTVELQYKELITNVASSSSGFILNFDIPPYVEVPDSQKWNSIFVAYLDGITGCLPPRSCNSIIYFLHQTSKDAMMQMG